MKVNLTSTFLKSEPFWDITRRRVVIVYRCFGTTYRSHLHGGKNYHTTKRISQKSVDLINIVTEALKQGSKFLIPIPVSSNIRSVLYLHPLPRPVVVKPLRTQ
jgi:hypothetical protein